MLRKIFNAVKSIGEFFSAVIDFIGFLIDSIIKFFSLIPKAVSYLTSSVGFLPVSILGMLSVIITVLIIKKVVNR